MYNAKYNNAYRSKRIEDGFCGACWSRKPEEGKVTCEICLDKRRQNGVLLKREVIQKYGGICRCCGEKEISFLTIDHMENNGQQERNLHGEGTVFYNWLRKNNFPENGYQVLCFNCNCGKRINGGICPHQIGKG